MQLQQQHVLWRMPDIFFMGKILFVCSACCNLHACTYSSSSTVVVGQIVLLLLSQSSEEKEAKIRLQLYINQLWTAILIQVRGQKVAQSFFMRNNKTACCQIGKVPLGKEEILLDRISLQSANISISIMYAGQSVQSKARNAIYEVFTNQNAPVDVSSLVLNIQTSTLH